MYKKKGTLQLIRYTKTYTCLTEHSPAYSWGGGEAIVHEKMF